MATSKMLKIGDYVTAVFMGSTDADTTAISGEVTLIEGKLIRVSTDIEEDTIVNLEQVSFVSINN